MARRFKLTRIVSEGGFGIGRVETSVVELDGDDDVPEGAEEVEPTTPLHDWKWDPVASIQQAKAARS